MPMRAGGDHDMGALDRRRAGGVVGAPRLAVGAKPKRSLMALLAARARGGAPGDGDLGAFDMQHRGGAHADRAGAGEHDAFLPASGFALASSATAAAAVVLEPLLSSITETRKFEKEALLDRLEHGFAGGHVAAADEDRGILLLLRPARVDRSVDEGADVFRRHAAIADDVIGAAVIADDRVEDAGAGSVSNRNKSFFVMTVSLG